MKQTLNFEWENFASITRVNDVAYLTCVMKAEAVFCIFYFPFNVHYLLLLILLQSIHSWCAGEILFVTDNKAPSPRRIEYLRFDSWLSRLCEFDFHLRSLSLSPNQSLFTCMRLSYWWCTCFTQLVPRNFEWKETKVISSVRWVNVNIWMCGGGKLKKKQIQMKIDMSRVKKKRWAHDYTENKINVTADVAALSQVEEVRRRERGREKTRWSWNNTGEELTWEKERRRCLC